MSINWTGSGSFLLNKQRRKQTLIRVRHRHNTIGDVDQEECFRNMRQEQSAASECAPSTAACESHLHTEPVTELGGAGSVCGSSRQAQGYPSKQLLTKSSFDQRRSWLLNQPDWVGAKQTQQHKATETEQSSPNKPAKTQPSPAPMLDSNSHSK